MYVCMYVLTILTCSLLLLYFLCGLKSSTYSDRDANCISNYYMFSCDKWRHKNMCSSLHTWFEIEMSEVPHRVESADKLIGGNC